MLILYVFGIYGVKDREGLGVRDQGSGLDYVALTILGMVLALLASWRFRSVKMRTCKGSAVYIRVSAPDERA